MEQEKEPLSSFAIETDYFSLSPDDVRNTLANLLWKHFPENKREPYYEGGYFWLPFPNPYSTEEAVFNTEARKIVDTMTHLFPNIQPEVLDSAKKLLGQEYKIHLMPKNNYILFVIEKILEIAKQDPQLAEKISFMKVIDMPAQGNEVFPTIVLYPKLGKDSAQSILQNLYEQLHPMAAIGDGRTPRYNQKIDDLLFYAQGASGLKKRYKRGLEELGKDPTQNDLYEPDFIHFKGCEKLSVLNSTEGIANSMRDSIHSTIVPNKLP